MTTWIGWPNGKELGSLCNQSPYNPTPLLRLTPRSWATDQRLSTNDPFAAIIPPASSNDAYRLYPPGLRRGTGGHCESHAYRRALSQPQDPYCYSPRKEVSTRSHHLPDRLRLRHRAPGRRGWHRHCPGRRLACHDHAWLREHALGHGRRDAAQRPGGAARGERRAAYCRHALRVLSG